MRIAGLIFAAGLSVATPAIACDSHDSPDNYFLAYIEMRGMTEAEIRAAERRAYDQWHEKQIEVARARFLQRFTPDPTPADRTTVAQQGNLGAPL